MAEPQTLTVLGIESSCDDTAAAVVRRHGDGRYEVLAAVLHSQTEAHAPYGGVVPEIAARAHAEKADIVIREALEEAGMASAEKIATLDGIAATRGPGLIGGVMVGFISGKALALSHGLPLLPVNHLEGHALSVLLEDPTPFPFLLLLVSGGHTQLLHVEAPGAYRRLGTTIDDAAGEAFDKTAKLLGLGQPGGPAVERAAGAGEARHRLPRPLLKRAGCDFSFSGLKTAVRLLAEENASVDGKEIADIAASFQAAASAHLCQRTGQAMQALEESGETRRLVVAGGVAANRAIRRGLNELCEERGWTLSVPAPEYCTDNGAMIAVAGISRLLRTSAPAIADVLALPALPRWPLDDRPAGQRHGGGKKGPKA